MAKLYYNKITNQETNPETGKAWVLEDVPQMWRAQVEEMLNEEHLSLD